MINISLPNSNIWDEKNASSDFCANLKNNKDRNSLLLSFNSFYKKDSKKLISREDWFLNIVIDYFPILSHCIFFETIILSLTLFPNQWCWHYLTTLFNILHFTLKKQVRCQLNKTKKYNGKQLVTKNLSYVLLLRKQFTTEA